MPAPKPLPIGAQLAELSGATMGTSWQVKLMCAPQLALATLQTGIQRELDLVVAQMSNWEADSDLSRFNIAAENTWHIMPPELFKVLDYALYIAQQSSGAFDPAIGKLVNLWGFGPEQKTAATSVAVPPSETIGRVMHAGSWQQIQIDRLGQRAYQPGDIHLDLSGIAKGFGVDQVARYLAAQDINSYLVEVGGELRGFGCKPDGSPWWAELEHPEWTNGDTGLAMNTIVALHGLSIATSGDYLRYFEHNGQRYSHTIDPRTGYPIQHNLAAVTVLHTDCMAADAHATAILVLGPEAGLAYAEQLCLACLLINRNAHGFSETMSSSMLAMLN